MHSLFFKHSKLNLFKDENDVTMFIDQLDNFPL